MKIKKDKMYLLIFGDNWADEMDVSGFITMNGKALKKAVKKIKKFKGDICLGIGTNEDIEYDSGKDFLSSWDIKEISEQEHQMLSKLFNVEDVYFEDKEILLEEYLCETEKHETWEETEERYKSLSKEEKKEMLPLAKQWLEEQKLEEKVMDAWFDENKGIDWQSFDIEKTFQSLSEEEKERLLEVHKNMPIADLSFGFGDLFERYMEYMDEYEDDEYDEDDE